tara:strand:+ start:168 stop:362 length:195 start_codon:yes stop_codon:yes gene_type:complete
VPRLFVTAFLYLFLILSARMLYHYFVGESRSKPHIKGRSGTMETQQTGQIHGNPDVMILQVSTG